MYELDAPWQIGIRIYYSTAQIRESSCLMEGFSILLYVQGKRLDSPNRNHTRAYRTKSCTHQTGFMAMAPHPL